MDTIWNRRQDETHPSPYCCKKIGANKSRMILKAHILTGSHVTSKVGTKTAALKAKPERYLQGFGENTFVTDLAQAEKYLVNVVHAKSTCATSDKLRYNIYTSKNKTLTELPPTSSAIRGHLLRCHYYGRTLSDASMLYFADVFYLFLCPP